nr:scavenger receptor cysteine-rich type 1 protein M130-like [Danio rerio]|eukprot:XP_021330840.1 scavenger receptor cysteine-rich type 1 protein M130-like [Danio rerio]
MTPIYTHVPLRLRGGHNQCSGRLEVYHNAVWGSVCDDLWDFSDAQVVCRQLGCGAALRADGNSAFGAGEGVVWLNRVQCRGNELHLWDCPLSLNNHTDCSHKEHAGLTCADLSVSTTPATSASPSGPMSQTVSSTSVSCSQTRPETLAVPPVLVIVLGVVLVLLLVALLILIQQNRLMRKALADWYTGLHRAPTEAVYEEIYQRHNDLRESFISQEQRSGFGDGDALLPDRINAGMSDYEDIAINVPIPDETDDKPEDYDDVITIGQNCAADKVNTPENYDDVIISEQCSHCESEEGREYDDAWSISEDMRNLLDYDDVVEESDTEKEAV